jgi:hypothetical protein
VLKGTEFRLDRAVVGDLTYQPGDTRGLGYSVSVVRQITRVTKTFVVLEDGSKWTMRGDEYGAGSRSVWARSVWARRSLYLVTDEAEFRKAYEPIRAHEERRSLCLRVRDVIDRRTNSRAENEYLTADQCRAILAAIGEEGEC